MKLYKLIHHHNTVEHASKERQKEKTRKSSSFETDLTELNLNLKQLQKLELSETLQVYSDWENRLVRIKSWTLHLVCIQTFLFQTEAG